MVSKVRYNGAAFERVEASEQPLAALSSSAADFTIDNGNYLWDDIIGQLTDRGGTLNPPTFVAVTNGAPFFSYSFAPDAINEIFTVYHIPHNYAMGTKLYLHIHWFNDSAVPNTGNVVWDFKYVVAKGHGQQAFNFATPTTATVIQASPATRYLHNIAEVAVADAVPATSLEPDSLVFVNISRNGTHVSDTCTQAVKALMADCHFQVNKFGTKNKAPNFYA